MKVTVRLFAILRDRAGAGEVHLELADGARADDALAAMSELVGEVPVMLAINRRYARGSDPLSEGDELALIPPVSGGERESDPDDLVSVTLTDRPLSSDSLLAVVRDPRAGAVVLFAGVTREVERLEYEAYAEMAVERMDAIARTAHARHDLCRVAVAHRTGSVPLSEPSVLVAASAPHRGEAFAGAREIIDAVKAQAPIWKREIGAAGGSWVAGTQPDPG